MLSDMHVIVYCNEGPDSGIVYYTENLDGDTKMNCRAFAERVAASLGFDIAKPSGHIGNYCGDLRVEFVDHRPNIVDGRYQGSTRIWSGESYYFAHEGE
jgi:hypothetical protein